jgi:phosphoribosylanthranilate isomerase
MNLIQRERLVTAFARGDLVKICGLRDPEHAVAATEAGADFISFIFAPSRRQVSAATVRACVDAAHGVSRSTPVLAVGVFVDVDPAVLTRTVEEAGLDLVQLSGQEPVSYVQELSIPAIKGFQPHPGEESGAILDAMSVYITPANGAIAALIDGYHPTAKGGTGIRADWRLAAEVCSRQPFMLAGGLDPENVEEAIATVAPLGVDVSGGIERDGVKDPRLIAEFVHRARRAFAERRAVLQASLAP